MLKFWKKSENSNLNCKKSSSTAKTVNFQEEVTVFQSSAADEIKTQISIQTKATASRKFKLFSIIKWRSKKRKRKNKNSSIKRRKSKKGKKPSKGKEKTVSIFHSVLQENLYFFQICIAISYEKQEIKEFYDKKFFTRKTGKENKKLTIR